MTGVLRSPWALRAMTDESRKVAARLDLTVLATSPQGPFLVRFQGKELRGRDVNALVAQAYQEWTNAG